MKPQVKRGVEGEGTWLEIVNISIVLAWTAVRNKTNRRNTKKQGLLKEVPELQEMVLN